MPSLAYRLYWSAERALAPSLRYSQDAYEDLLRSLVNSRTVWLDVGCGHRVLSAWRFDAERELVNRAGCVAGVDTDAAALAKHQSIKNTWVAPAEDIPFSDGTFNLVTANMVIEHLSDPARAFAEISRVLAPGGLFLFHTPNAQGYVVNMNKLLPGGLKKFLAKMLDGRDAEDVYPTYYRCNSKQSIVPVAQTSGLRLLEIRYIPSNAICAKILPIATLELCWIRATMQDSLAQRRTNIIGLLTKPQ